jgi:hypothetical protein
MATHKLIVRNAKQLVTVCSQGEKVKIGNDMDKVTAFLIVQSRALTLEVSIIENGSLVVDLQGIIEAVGPADEINKAYSEATFHEEIDATGKHIAVYREAFVLTSFRNVCVARVR